MSAPLSAGALGDQSGSAQRRLDGLHEMFALPEVRAITCARGGYGCNYLLPGLDLELIRRNPKVFVGYSDVTTLRMLVSVTPARPHLVCCITPTESTSST